MADEDYW